ncbi:transporter substrate-binding domain-containing protein [bacterium]|nr:transporter substrate-binding domain-containing protein [bacterium]
MLNIKYSLETTPVASILLTLLVLFPSFVFASPHLTIMTENYPPYNYQENNTLKGTSVEIIRAILEELQITSKIEFLPWSRAYKAIQQHDNQVLFSMSRTAARENMFKWVGPLIQDDVFLYKKKGSPISIQHLGDAKKYIVGVKKKTSRHNFLKKNGFEHIYIDHSSVKFPLLKMLLADRIDLWPMSKMSAAYILKLAEIDPNTIEPAFKILSQELYIAFSKSTSDEIINEWQTTLDTLNSNGKYNKIMHWPSHIYGVIHW